MSEVIIAIVAVVLLAVLIWHQRESIAERKTHMSQIMDLCDRIMAGDYDEYVKHKPTKEFSKTRNFYKKHFAPQDDSSTVDLSGGKEEERL